MSNLFFNYTLRPFTNIGIEEDADDPKEPAHLDYKYIKSYAGPLARPGDKYK